MAEQDPSEFERRDPMDEDVIGRADEDDDEFEEGDEEVEDDEESDES
jgi:hypothetical protein